MAEIGRGMTPLKEKFWKHMYQQEDSMRLKWFHKNQQRLIQVSEQATKRKGLSPQVLAEVEKLRQQRYRNATRHTKKKAVDLDFPDIDPHSITNIMKPIAPRVQQLLYTNMEKEGRRNYLTERYKSKPEERYYFTETSSFKYGWKLTDSEGMEGGKFGRRQIIKNSFYRRNGPLKNDPDFYRLPQENSPTVCRR